MRSPFEDPATRLEGLLYSGQDDPQAAGGIVELTVGQNPLFRTSFNAAGGYGHSLTLPLSPEAIAGAPDGTLAFVGEGSYGRAARIADTEMNAVNEPVLVVGRIGLDGTGEVAWQGETETGRITWAIHRKSPKRLVANRIND